MLMQRDGRDQMFLVSLEAIDTRESILNNFIDLHFINLLRLFINLIKIGLFLMPTYIYLSQWYLYQLINKQKFLLLFCLFVK